MKYSIEDYLADLPVLALQIGNMKDVQKKYDGIYGIPRGGVILARDLSNFFELPLLETPTKNTLVVDDICDSGRTAKRYPNNDIAVLFTKNTLPTFSVRKAEEWIEFWWEGDREKEAEDIVVRMLEHIGEDPTREGLRGTPERVVRMWKEIYRGYDDKQIPRMAIFPNGEDGLKVDEMVIDTGYFFSQCEHHLVPFFGQYYFAYVPDKKIIGLSKVARIVDHFSAKAQIQERLVKEVLDHIEKELEPRGCALIMKGRHLCKEMRGVKKVNGTMISSDLRGIFKDKDWTETRAEFLSLIK